MANPLMDPAGLTEDEQELLRERRREWWSRMWAVAVGVFTAQLAFSGVAYLALKGWVESL